MTKKYKNLNQLLNHYRLILASGSPRRVYLLTQADLDFRQIIPDIDESNNFYLKPYQLAVYLAQQKAAKVIDQSLKNDIILGCDTIVILKDRILGKPKSNSEAIEMLSSLSGKKHTVCSAIALIIPSYRELSGYELTDVYFKEVTKKEIVEYVETGEPLDKAGAYGIQDKGVFLVDRVVGNIDNVIGLPMTLLDAFAGKLMEKNSNNEI